MNPTKKMPPNEVLSKFTLAKGVYLLGTFETGLTIYNQQVRALNLVWSVVQTAKPNRIHRVAVVGGGVAGLTAAAGFLHKGVEEIWVFEKRATLCPLQTGSDTRWVHPRIYDWPNEDSRLPTAALPLLNWNAGRASDMAVEVLDGWEKLVDTSRKRDRTIHTYLNVKHLRLHENREVEWVGDESCPEEPNPIASGKKLSFDCIVLAVGFGLEHDTAFSYWRNETLGQPELDLGRRTYLISGHGDGALVDLFRVRISRFRQDRILVELFEKDRNLMNALRGLKRAFDSRGRSSKNLYDKFQAIAEDPNIGFQDLISALRLRLRRDTAAILQMNVDSFRKVFSSKASFQNLFLLFALYQAGGVIPTGIKDIGRISKEFDVERNSIIVRHGTERRQAVEEVVEADLLKHLKRRLTILESRSQQPSNVCWDGGYWHQHSKVLSGKPLIEDNEKGKWRMEHLPAATEVFVTGFIAAVAGYLRASKVVGDDFRVTLHRALFIGPEVTLQQTTHYAGPTNRTGLPGRTFNFANATIGYAADLRRIIRTRQQKLKETDKQYWIKLQRDMQELELEKDSQPMDSKVRSLLALPILTRNKRNVLGVLYADSTQSSVFRDECIATISEMCSFFAAKIGEVHSEHVNNFEFPQSNQPSKTRLRLVNRLQVIEVLERHSVPFSIGPNYLNIEFTDFVSLEKV